MFLKTIERKFSKIVSSDSEFGFTKHGKYFQI